MKFIYETPFDLFDDLERKELIRITKKNCPDCTSDTCHAPQIVIPNMEKFKSFLDIQIKNSEVEIEKLGLIKMRKCSEDDIRMMYASLMVARKLQDNPLEFLEAIGISSSNIEDLFKLLQDIGLNDKDILGPLTDLLGEN